MRRWLTLVVMWMVSVCAFAQVGQRITTRSEKLADFPLKVTKVVLSGNPFQDIALKEAVRNAWTLSPYEFCTAEEFQRLKGSDRYYFMLRTENERQRGISFLTLVKGGADKVEDMLEVFTMPVGAAGATQGSEEMFLTALVSVMQEHAERALSSSIVSLGSVSGGIARLSKMKLYFSEKDLCPQIGDSFKATRFGRDMYIVDEYGAEDIILSGAYDTAVSYVIAPVSPQKGDWCYKMLLDARTHELLYYTKHRITASRGAGFLKSDIRKLAGHR
ncbi:MAG: hypothetical protein IJ652_06145 [Bacteroidales bacterium]|nr:hypothetical protein [Bacteroidales bacterium]